MKITPTTQHYGDNRQDFPELWWTPVPESERAEWEILPQAAGRGEVILSKRHGLGVLSNFAPTPFIFRGEWFASIEGMWQMMFYPEYAGSPIHGADPRATYAGLEWPYDRAEVAKMAGFDAWFAGDLGFKNMQRMGINWVSFQGERYPYWVADKGAHYDLIVEALRAKLAQNPEVREALLSTGDLQLKPDHFQPDDAPPSWKYYLIWMELRGELQMKGNC